MSELARVWKIDGVEACTYDDVLVLWQFGEYTVAAAQANSHIARLLAKYPDGFRVVLLVEPETPQPNERVRQILMKADHSHRKAFAIVTFSSGFRAALVNAVASAIALVNRARSPVKAFSDIESAASWIGAFAKTNDSDRVRRALDEVRAGSAR